MINFLYVFFICLLLLVVAFFIVLLLAKAHSLYEKETEFIDENGDHEYYERSIIEKKRFHKLHPEIPEHDLRTIHRLFSFLQLKK